MGQSTFKSFCRKLCALMLWRNPVIKVLFLEGLKWAKSKNIVLVRSLYKRFVCIFPKALVPIGVLLKTCSLNQYCSFGRAMSSYGSSKHFAKCLYCPNPHFCVCDHLAVQVSVGICCWGWLLFKLQAFWVQWKLFPALKCVKWEISGRTGDEVSGQEN